MLLAVSLPFDCFVVSRRVDGSLSNKELFEAIARRADWVEVFGLDAENIHDAIDRASVEAGRQRRIGEGTPMTAWHEDLSDDQAIASYILTGGQGVAEHKVVVVIGSIEDEQSIVRALRTQP